MKTRRSDLYLLPRTLLLALCLATSTYAQSVVSLSVSARMDIYRAGGNEDGSDGIAPVVMNFRPQAGRTMVLASAGGTWTCNGAVGAFGPDGDSGRCANIANVANPVNQLSAYQATDFRGALVGVFLENSLPAIAPPSLRFYLNDMSAGGIRTDFRTLSPVIGQVFFIGDGLTGTNAGPAQVFLVPPTASHLYLGYSDTCSGGADGIPGCYSNNAGTISVNVAIKSHRNGWVEPQLTSEPPSVRCCMGLAFDAAGQNTVMFGGGNGGVFPRVRYGDTWIWRNGWTQVFPPVSPKARKGMAMAYDGATGTVVLFGGDDASGTVLNDTWLWDGTTWTQEFPPVSPPAVSFDTQAMVFDNATGTILMYENNSNRSLDLWEWNGRTKTWRQLFPLQSPPPRGSAPIAYDIGRNEVVLFAGNTSTFYNDTWVWNGVTWIQRFPALSPSPRGLPSMAYDPLMGQVVLFGGSPGPPSGFDDTWAWDGENWRQLNRPTHPGGRWAAGMTYDPLSRGVLLFGGELIGNPFANDLWVFRPVPVF